MAKLANTAKSQMVINLTTEHETKTSSEIISNEKLLEMVYKFNYFGIINQKGLSIVDTRMVGKQQKPDYIINKIRKRGHLCKTYDKKVLF
jgi:aspartate carbamoyltransferase catalytic subunit